MSAKVSGSCICEAVRYEVAEIKLVGNCHCTICKKLTGASFSIVAIVGEDDFAVIQGSSHLQAYQVNDNGRKYFCGICGSPIYNLNKKYPGNKMVCVGSFDNPALVAPSVNVHCENKLPWVSSIETLKNFERDIS